MKPTLFADAIPDEIHSERKYWMNAREALRVLKPILPKRCPVDHDEHTREANSRTDEAGNPVGWECLKCEGRGWLYPEEPEWWKDYGKLITWEMLCEWMWQAIGILDE